MSNRLKFLAVIIFSSVVCISSLIGQTISLDKKSYKVGDQVNIQVKGYTGKLGIESDILMQSTVVEVKPNTPINAGRIKKTGLYRIYCLTTSVPKKEKSFAILVTKNSYTFSMQSRQVAKNGKSSALSRIIKATKRADLKRAFVAVDWNSWAAKNAAVFGKTTVACTVAVAIPNPVAARECIGGITTHTVDASAEILLQLIKIMKNKGVITASEALKLQQLVKLSNSSVTVAVSGSMSPKNWQDWTTLSATLGGLLLEESIDTKQGKVMARLGTDSTSKFIMLLKLTK